MNFYNIFYKAVMTLFPQRTGEGREEPASIDISGMRRNILDTVGDTQEFIERLGIDGGNGVVATLKPEDAKAILQNLTVL